MDAFFASVEQRDKPELKGKPIAVGGNRSRGVVAAASYEAREYGVHSAMPSAIAARKCPHLIFVKPKFDTYINDSRKIMEIFQDYTELVEPLSLDEAFLDVTQTCIERNTTAFRIAKEIKQRIKHNLDLTASAGVSINKFLAKVASGFKKPDGLFVIQPHEAEMFINDLPIKKVPGIGKVTQAKMHDLGINNCLDIKNRDRKFLENAFGKSGAYFHDLVNLKINNPVTPDRIRKSIGAERTFNDNIDDIEIMIEKLKPIVNKVSDSMKKKEIAGRTVTLKIKYHDFVINTRSRTLEHYISEASDIMNIVHDLLHVPVKPTKSVRLLGIQVSNLNINEQSGYAEQLAMPFF